MPNLNIPVSVRSIAFIDTQVEDYQSLIAGVTPGTEVVILDGNKDAIDQITDILGARSNIDSIHIVSHGSSGSLQLGDGSLSLDDIECDRHDLQQWFSPRTDSILNYRPHILLYGCNVAAGETGKAFIKRLSELTGASVAASQNLTGSAAKGGDWFLEVTAEKIATPLAFRPEVLAAYNHVLSSFSTATNFSAGFSPTATPLSIGTGDFNGDGFPDLAVVNLNSRDISILLGTGTGSFGTATNLFNPGNENPFFSVVRDFNGDGNLDLAVANPLSGANGDFVSIRLGTGTGTFGNPTNFGQGINPRSIAAGDFNGDDRLDLATAPLSGNNLSILLGDGTGSFSTPVSINAGPSLSIATADFNGDDQLDLVTSNNTATNNISVLLGDGTGNFSAPVNFSAGTGNHFVVTGDFNGDSKLDLAVSNTGSNNVSVLLGDGTGNFGTTTNFSVGSSPESVITGDFNGDGKLDLAASNGGDNNVSVLLGDGTGNFGTAVNFSVGTIPRSIAAADFNADGQLDLATPNFTSKDVSILLNTPNTVNLGATTYSGTEGATDTVVNIPVTISGRTPLSDVVVPIVIDPSSTATENSDYTISPPSITFPAGATGAELTQNVAVTIKPDNLPENDETTILNFDTITGGVAGTIAQTTLTIAANGQPSSLSPYQIDLKTGTITGQPNPFISLVNTPTDSNADSWFEAVAKINFDGNIKKAKFIVEYDQTPSGWTVNLGDSGSNDGYGGDATTQSRDAEMNIVNGNMSVFGNDYNTPPGGELTQGNVPNFVSNGSRVEFEVSNEQLGWDNKNGLKNSLNSPYLYALNGQPDATGPVNSEIYAGFNRVISGPGDRIGSGASKVTILLNPIDYAISAGVATVTEGNAGTTAATFTVTRSGCTELASTVDYAIAGTADSSDYNNIGGTSGATAATGTINFAAGETSKTITLDVLGDAAIETNETLEVTLSNPSVLDSTPTITIATATTTITNDDVAPPTPTPTPTPVTPTPTPTPVTPTPTPTTETPTPTPTPVTPTPTPTTETPTPTPTTGTPTPTPTTETPTPTPTTETPTPTPTPVTPTPTPTPVTPTPTPTPVTPTPTPTTETPTPTPTTETPTPTPTTETPTPTPTTETPTPTPTTETPTPTPTTETPTPTPTTETPTPTPTTETPTPTPTPVTPTPTPTTETPTPVGTIDTQKNWCGVEAGLDKLEKILDDQLQTINLPIVGPLKDISPDFIGNIKTKLVDTIKNQGNQTLSQLETSLRTALGSDFNVALTENSSADESTLLITLGKQYQFPDLNLSQNLGVPALSLDVDGKAKSKYNYNLSLGVGVSKDFACYIDTDKTKLTANLDLNLDDQFKAKGNLGFFQVDLANDTNNPTKVDANLEVKLNDLDNLGGPNDGARLTLPELQGNYQFKDLFNANLTTNANLGLTANTSINGNAAFPSYNFELAVDWPILNYANGQLTGPQKPAVAFNNMQLDLGTFVNNFAKPIIGKISDVIKPFRPVINFLNADTKLLSTLGLAGEFDKNGDGIVSVLELAAKISGRDIDTRFLDAVAKVDKVVDLANQIANSPDKIDFGSYTLENIDVSDQSANLQNASPVPKTAIQQTPNEQINSQTSATVKDFLNALQDIDGFDLPLLTQPETAIQLLIGKPDVPVFSYQMPQLGFDFNIDQKFPIWGPLEGLLEGNFSASAHLGFGYDTYGLDQWKNSNFAAGSADQVLNGFYVSDRENADGTGPDVDELSLDASIAVGAGIDAKIVEGYVKGGIQGKVGIDLIDIGEFQPKQGGDGKIRVSEITSRISQPSVLFDVTGQVNAFLGAEAKVISVKFCEKTIPAVKVWTPWGRKKITPEIKIPYPCGFDYKTVYDNNFATFELASFSLGPSSSTRGRAINGYMAGATVFFDANFNGVKDDNEPFSITNADGSFDLDVSLDQFDKNNSGDLEPDEGKIVLIDGINTSTYLPQQTPLFATPDATVVTPLTTLWTELIEQGTDPNQAQIQVKSALGVSSGIDLTSYDPLQGITQNDPNGLAVYAVHAQVQNTIVLVTDLISGASTTAKNEIASSVISAIANQLKSGSLDLSNSTQVQAIIQSATSQLQVPQVSSIASDAAKIIAEGNQRIKALASSNSSPSDAATEIARIQKVAQGEVAQDLLQVAAGNKTIQSAISENTGASLNTQIQSATANNPTVRNTLDTDDSSTPSTPDEPFPESGIEFVKDGENTTESTDGDDTIMGSASDDIVRGRKGNDLLFSLDGNDWMNGNQGNDLTDGGIGDDTLYGGKGFDTLTGGAGNDFLSGNRGEDMLIGEKGEDTLYGGQGNDILLGGQGNDFLSGDLGDDTLVGDVGSDRFLLSTNSGIDTIDDFEVGQDLLVLGNGLTFSQLAIAEDRGAILIRFAQTGEILASLGGVSASSISAANFGLI
ncbi:DUF4347 domain-containing protein [Microcoleus vaginatus]|uniref:DUF4347 domain-containing protein n=1 Tax=Microcoleus vaginatus TaxID=119532 RepID=UPI004040AE86